MSSRYDKIVGDFKPGSITLLKLKNFLTYNKVEIRPGPRLNMVIGANGTGKSSILCALCLGLGGEPKLLGRADDARQFIMHEKDKAKIEITLAPLPGKPEHVLTRVIDRAKGSERGNGRGASTFFINDQKVPIKDIQHLVQETYNIQVGNLCTFLPQDKVGSFSGFDTKQLLLETEKTLPGQVQYRRHLQLIEWEKDMNSGDHSLDTIKEKLEKLKADQQRFEREKERMEERNLALKQVEMYQEAMTWKDYNNTVVEYTALNKEKKELKQQLKAAQEECQPLEERVTQLEKRKHHVEARYKDQDKQCGKYKADMVKQQKKYEAHEDAMDEDYLKLQSVDAERNRKLSSKKAAQERVDKLKGELSHFDADTVERDYQEASKAKRDAHRACTQARQDVSQILNHFKEHETQAERVSERLAKLNDEKTQRKRQLFNSNPDLAKIAKWLDQNRKNFRRQVWGPVAAEVSMKTKNAAAYLEQHVPNSALTSFIVEDKADYDKLYHEVRRNLQVPINIILVRNGELEECRRPVGDKKMEILKREHGVIGFLDEAFKAPDAVLQGLRSIAAVHKCLVGGDETQKSLDDRGLLEFLAAPDTSLGQSGKQGSCIFASKGHSSKKYTQMVSRYNGNINSRIDDIGPSRILAKGADPEVKKRLEQDLQKIHDEMNDLRPKLAEAEKKKAHVEKEGQRVAEANSKAKESKEMYTKLKQKLVTANSKLRDAEKDLEVDDRSKKQEIFKGIMNRLANIVSALEAHAASHDKVLDITFSNAAARIDKEAVAQLHRKAVDAAADKRRESQDLEQRCIAAQENAKKKKEEAMKLKDNLTFEDDGKTPKIPEEIMGLLENEVEDLEAMLGEAEEKVNAIHNDPNAIRQYEQNQRDIEEVEEELQKAESSKDRLGGRIEKELNVWNAALENTTNEINKRFVGYMQELGVTGEVRLKKGGEEGKDNRDFKDWGIEIRVSFRQGVKAQVLSAQVQSGGERSVSTILFLMAMQDLMASPFRCVDEINQGMDERNERAIFKRIVQNSTGAPKEHSTDHCGQYFLITPKLLPSLLDMEQEAVTVLVVMNGPFNFDSPTDFSVKSIVEARSRRKKRQSIEPEDDEENQENHVPRRGSKKKKRRSS